MPIIDPNKNPVGLDERLKGESDPRLRRMLEEVRFHIAVEAAGDIDSAIARLAPSAEYVIYDITKAPTRICGHAAIRKDFYLTLFDTIEPRLEWDIVLCMVDGNAVITEGQQKNAVKGSVLIAAGVAADPNKVYLQDARHLVVWPFDSQLRLIGETVYLGYSTPLQEVAQRPLRAEDIGTYSGPVIKPS
jgi:hypothetical protein